MCLHNLFVPEEARSPSPTSCSISQCLCGCAFMNLQLNIVMAVWRWSVAWCPSITSSLGDGWGCIHRSTNRITVNRSSWPLQIHGLLWRLKQGEGAVMWVECSEFFWSWKMHLRKYSRTKLWLYKSVAVYLIAPMHFFFTCLYMQTFTSTLFLMSLQTKNPKSPILKRTCCIASHHAFDVFATLLKLYTDLCAYFMN